jgi:hypothetical protein
MPHSTHDGEILARYILEPAAWDAFVRAARAHPHGSWLDLRDASEAGRTVVVADDAVHVGHHRLDLRHFHVHQVIEHDAWLQLVELDADYAPWPLPLPTRDAVLAASLVRHFRAVADSHTLASMQRAAQAEAERLEPTPSNRLLWFVERYFIACLLAFFFVVLPIGAVLAAWVIGE